MVRHEARRAGACEIATRMTVSALDERHEHHDGEEECAGEANAGMTQRLHREGRITAGLEGVKSRLPPRFFLARRDSAGL